MKNFLIKLKKNDFFKGIALYSLIFSIFVLVIYGTVYILNGKLFIWNVDGLEQHYIVFVDYITRVKEFLLNGTPIFYYDLNIGLGADNYTQYLYYIVGDIFAYLGVLFPSNHLDIAYSFIILLRLYFVGISFFVFAKYMKKNTYLSVLGSVFYTFSSFAMFSGIRHPYFLLPMIMLPLLFLAIERLLQEDKKIFFSIVIFISLLFNFYFLYMLLILGIIYFIIRLICEKRKDKKSFCIKKIKCVLLYGFIGMLLGMFVFLPVVYTFLNSGRTGVFELFMYPFYYYELLFSNLISFTHTKYWSQIYSTFLVVLLLPIIVKNIKKEKPMIIFGIVMAIFLCVPIFGSLMNGFSFPNNRYAFAFVFAISYLVISNIKVDLNYSAHEKKLMLLALCFYLIILLLLDIDFNINVVIGIIFTVISYMLIIFSTDINKRFKKNCAVLVLGFVSLLGSLMMCYNYNSPVFTDLASRYLNRHENNILYETQNNEIYGFKQAIDKIKEEDNSLYRITDTSSRFDNLPLLYNYNSISNYLSLSSKYEEKISNDLKNDKYYISRYINNFSNRSKITTLLGSKYLITNYNYKNIPYGYSKYKDINGYNAVIYKNDYALPLSLIYTDCINEKTYNNLSPLTKEDSLITYYVSKNCNNDKNYKVENELKYDVVGTENLKIKDGKIEVNYESSGKLDLEFENSNNSEIYILIDGFDFRSYTKEEIRNFTLLDSDRYANYKFNYDMRNYISSNDFIINAKYNDKNTTYFTLDQKSSPYYMDNDTILLNLGYMKKHTGKATLSFMNSGVYSFDSIKVLEVSFNNFNEKIEKLKENQVDLKYENNRFYGTYNSKENGIMQLTIPYDKGWSAFVDGKEVKVEKVNNYFTGIKVSKGKHNFEFIYKTYLLREGIVLSIFGVIVLFICVLVNKKKIKM